jgi:hypothetical protein
MENIKKYKDFLVEEIKEIPTEENFDESEEEELYDEFPFRSNDPDDYD